MPLPPCRQLGTVDRPRCLCPVPHPTQTIRQATDAAAASAALQSEPFGLSKEQVGGASAGCMHGSTPAVCP